MPDGREIVMNGRREILRRISIPVSLTPEQLAKRQQIDSFKADYAKTVIPQYTVAGSGPLSEREKLLQKVILARDFDTLFELIPLSEWKPRWQMGKYSFVQKNGQRFYVPWTEQDLADFIYSRHYTIQPGYTCPESQLDAGLRAHWSKQQAHKAIYPSTDWKHIWPMYPGGGYPGQGFGCEKYRPSTWVKIRKKVYIAVAVVAAVYLGPMVLEKVGSMLASGAGGGAGAGGAGAGAAGASAAGGVATAAETTTFLATVKSAVTVYNETNSVVHIVQGKSPPPPIGITGNTFKAAALNAVKEEVKKKAIDEAMKAGIKYVQKKMTAKEEAKIKAEISELQRRMAELVPPGTPMMPSPELPENDRKKIREIQLVQAKREQNNMALLALAAGAGLFLLAG